MRFDQKKGLTAYQILKTIPFDELQEVLEKYGDFSPHRATTIMRAISKHQASELLKTTQGMTQILRSLRCSKQEITRVFQALRILTNHELDDLDIVVDDLPAILAP